MTESNCSDIATVSTLVLLGDKEFVLRASRGRVLFENYSQAEVLLEKTITLTLDCRLEDQLTEDSSVSIILSAPSTSRFELSANDATSSPFEGVMSCNSSRTYTVKFNPPKVSESDYAWDNFQDQVIVHTRLCKLVIRFEAWKLAVPSSFSHGQESSLLFPVSLPEVKAPALRLFGAIERNADKKDLSQRHRAPSPSFTETTKSTSSQDINNLEVASKPRPSQTELLPSLSRPPSSDRQGNPLLSARSNTTTSSFESIAQLPLSEVTAVESQREAREVILKLRSRRIYQSNTKVQLGTSPTSIADTELFPETVALDADTKADLEQFNILVVAARDQVTKETEKAKSELAYYQQLLPKPPSRGATSETPTTVVAAQKPRKSRISATTKRPSKLPSLVRPTSGAASTSSFVSVNNQEIIPLEQVSSRQKLSRQQITRNTKLQSRSTSTEGSQRSQQQKSTKPTNSKTRKSTNNQLQQDSELCDFDDPDPEVDEAPTIPDDLSGVSTLDADD